MSQISGSTLDSQRMMMMEAHSSLKTMIEKAKITPKDSPQKSEELNGRIVKLIEAIKKRHKELQAME